MKRIVLFASGSGSNVQRIVEYFSDNNDVEILKVYCNKPDAFVLKRAENLKISTLTFSRSDFYENKLVLSDLFELNPDLIVLAGFLWLIPSDIISKFPNKIINIHPALLPKYGGKGMHGINVHKAVKDNNEKESGITIHFVNEKYDDGNIIFQAKFNILPNDTAENIAEKIHQLEYEYFPVVIEEILNNR
ncbi:MAG: phosphoribosylglycinamide formyltransferase [Bacteroidota bacterium]